MSARPPEKKNYNNWPKRAAKSRSLQDYDAAGRGVNNDVLGLPGATQTAVEKAELLAQGHEAARRQEFVGEAGFLKIWFKKMRKTLLLAITSTGGGGARAP